MFCPQCRKSWPKGTADSSDRSNPTRQPMMTPQRGRVSICPNCKVPLAADRIQGEFPSVAHASSTKEGTITVKDVLRETSSGGIDSGEVPLDDQKKSGRFKIFEKDSAGKTVLSQSLRSSSLFRQSIFFKSVLVCFAVSFCILTIMAMKTNTSYGRRSALKTAALAHPAGEVSRPAATHRTLSEVVASLMPTSIGSWTRAESDADIAQAIASADGTAQTFVSTYRVGKDHVELWATKLISNTPLAQMKALALAPLTVHTDSGIVNIPAKMTSRNSLTEVAFDYSPKNNSGYWIQPNQILRMGLPHTRSWYRAPYLVTVASNSEEDADNFATKLEQTIN